MLSYTFFSDSISTTFAQYNKPQTGFISIFTGIDAS